MSHWFQKPENAYKRANELISMPNPDPNVVKRQRTSALEILHDALTSKRNKTWQKIHEDIMILYIDVCVELQLGRIAKDGLHQYRNLSLQQNPGSLEHVMRYFLEQAELKAQEAKKYSNAISLALEDGIDDLEASESPETLLLSTTTMDDHRERATKEHVLPWLRFLWESYRTILDILRNNTKLEHLYFEVSSKAFQFCYEFQRKIEFRRLCEILRGHLSNIQKHASAPNTQTTRQLRGWEGWTPESVELHLQIRYEQLEVASQLELWTEGFRTIEDIHAVMGLIERVPKVSLMATYYEKLIQIFWVSNNYLFHAYAWYKFYTLSRNQNTKITPEQITAMASAIMLAALSIPIIEESSTTTDSSNTVSEGSTVFDYDIQKEKTQRMASLMGFSTSPKRADLLQSLLDENVLGIVLPEIQQLYEHLEKKFHPLQVASLVKPILDTLRQNKELSQYVPALEKLLVQRLLSQLTTVYSSVTIKHFFSLMAGLEISSHEVEQIIVRSVQNGHFQVQIDHREGCLRFGDLTLESKQLREQLSTLGRRLFDCVEKINSKDKQKIQEAALKEKSVIFSAARDALDEANLRMLNRKIIIEKKKEEIERLQLEMQKNEERRREEHEKQRREMERARLEQEAKRREKEKHQRIKDEIALKETKQMLDRLGRDTENLDIQDLESVDRDKILQQAKEKAQKAKEEAQKKLKDQAKRLDYIVRATREAELPILKKSYKEQLEKDREAHAKSTTEFLQKHREDYDFSMKEKQRLLRIENTRSKFESAHATRRRKLYEAQLLSQQQRTKIERLEQRIARAQSRYSAEQKRLEEEAAEAKRREEEEERIRVAKRIREAELRQEEEARAREEQERRGSDRFGRRDTSPARDEWQRVGPPSGRYVPPSRRGDEDSGAARSTGRRYVPPGARDSDSRDSFRHRDDRRDDRDVRRFDRRDDDPRRLDRRDDDPRRFDRRDDGFRRTDRRDDREPIRRDMYRSGDDKRGGFRSDDRRERNDRDRTQLSDQDRERFGFGRDRGRFGRNRDSSAERGNRESSTERRRAPESGRWR